MQFSLTILSKSIDLRHTYCPSPTGCRLTALLEHVTTCGPFACDVQLGATQKMQPNSASKRSNALNNLKRQPPAAKASPGKCSIAVASLLHFRHKIRLILSDSAQHTRSVTAGVPRFSAATSHEQNDAYMQDFDAAYTELEALSLARKYVPGKSAHWSAACLPKKPTAAKCGNCHTVQGED